MKVYVCVCAGHWRGVAGEGNISPRAVELRASSVLELPARPRRASPQHG